MNNSQSYYFNKLFSEISLIILTMIAMNTIFLMLNHPLAMGLTLIMQTALAALMAGIMSSTFWFSYLLVLIFLGGMLILFIYVSTLAPNEPLNSPPSQFFLTFLLLTIFMVLSLMMPSHLSANDNIYSFSPFSWMTSETLLWFFAFIIIFLFFVLVAVVKITKFWTGPLRPIN
uniref:NADH-ubiquinone oxidoreductase chain 6 n=1 Tax=Fabaeformiscandona kushiroensis TaxID=1564202 RepID=A0A0S3PNE7_9CRUS|nr:NADH dehydrogenase subunit 6 [Fabaeformiscandona kushiroensis]